MQREAKQVQMRRFTGGSGACSGFRASSPRDLRDAGRAAMQLLFQAARTQDFDVFGKVEQQAQRDVLAIEIERHVFAPTVPIPEWLQFRLEPLAETIEELAASARGDFDLHCVVTGWILLEVIAPGEPKLL